MRMNVVFHSKHTLFGRITLEEIFTDTCEIRMLFCTNTLIMNLGSIYVLGRYAVLLGPKWRSREGHGPHVRAILRSTFRNKYR